LYLQTTGANPTNVTQAVSAGTANQQWAILASSAPAFPIGLSAVAVTSTQVSLTWNAVAGATSYNVRRSTTSGGPYATIATGVTTTNYTDNVATAMKYYYVVSAVVSGVESLNSAEAALRFPKLTGTIIGTLGSYNSSGNTITNVFDNNLNTFFDGPTGNGCWVGLDFGVGASNLITQINYCPRSGFESRMVGGIFQGANQSNFSDAVTLFTVTAQPPAGAFTSVNITNTAAFRYVRYLSPNNGWGNVAELEFYGYPFSIPVPVPSGLIAQALSASQINLTWNALTNATSYNVKRSPASGGPYTTFATGVTTTNYTDTVTVGMKYYYVVSAICSGQETPNSVEATLNLPYPWLTQDVGAVGIPGGASYSSGVFTATGSGDDIWNAADAFRFIYVTNSGDCTIVARVISVQNIDAWSKAGVMIRASLASNAPNAMVAVTPGNGVTFQYRLTTNGTCSFANTTGLSAPYWVKLVRSGNTFAGYRSTDGTNWTQQGTTTTIVMGTTVNVGLALTSHNNTSLFAATFDNVTAPGWSSPMPPPAPTGLVAVPWTAQATLNWAASGTATSYNVKRATTNGGPYAIVANVTTTNSTDTGLINGTNYFYVVSALNPAGESTNSAQVNATPQLPVPPAPAGLVAAAVFSGQINLTWSVVTNAATYNVKRSTTNGGPYAVVASGVTGTNYNDTGLAAVTTFYYVVSAVNTGGESTNSAQVSATTPMAPPAAPAGLTATAVSTLQINLSWTASAGAESYNVKRSTTNGGPYTVIATGLTTTNYPNSGLDGGTVYYYVVSAVNSGGESTNSAQAAAATFSPTLGSLVHRYSFGETSGSTVADSVGGPVWTGTLPNGGTLSGGQLALTSGSQQYANLPSGVVSSLSNITVMVWLNLASVTYWSRLFDFGNDTTTYMYLTPWNGFDHTTRFTISTSGAGGEQKINCSQGVSPGAWHQLAVTLNAGVGVLYMDGLAVGTNSGMTLKPSSLGNTTRNYLGKSQSTSDPYLNGSLDEFRIYNVALSSAEIAATAALGPDQLLSTNPPTMSLALTETNLVITWPVACAGYTVQARTNLVSDSWVNVPSPAPQIVGAQWQVTLPGPGDNSAAFYRLAK
jgi:fibronectin type 3 domain-containing protein